MIKYSTFIIILLLINISEAAMTKYAIKQMPQFGDVVNIAGGRIAQNKKPSQIWSNICYITNQPLVSHKLVNLKTDYKAVDQQLNYNLATVIRYYMLNAHLILAKPSTTNVNIIIYVHQNSNAIYQEMQIKQSLAKYYPDLMHDDNISSENITAEFRYGYLPYMLNDYQQADIILAISPVAGLSELLQTNQIIVPTKIIPMNLDTMTLMLNKQYEVDNHLATIIEQIVDSQDRLSIDEINKKHISNKHNNSQVINLLDVQQFKFVNLVQVDSYFKPALLPDFFYTH